LVDDNMPEEEYWDGPRGDVQADRNEFHPGVRSDEPEPCPCPFYLVHGVCKRQTPYTLAPRRKRKLGRRLEGVALRERLSAVAREREESGALACWTL
jgi:hypothetical protein